MLRDIVSKVLFKKQPFKLTNDEKEICNKFIDDFNEVQEIKAKV